MNNIVINENTKIHTQMVTNNIEQYFCFLLPYATSNEFLHSAHTNVVRNLAQRSDVLLNFLGSTAQPFGLARANSLFFCLNSSVRGPLELAQVLEQNFLLPHLPFGSKSV